MGASSEERHEGYQIAGPLRAPRSWVETRTLAGTRYQRRPGKGLDGDVVLSFGQAFGQFDDEALGASPYPDGVRYEDPHDSGVVRHGVFSPARHGIS